MHISSKLLSARRKAAPLGKAIALRELSTALPRLEPDGFLGGISAARWSRFAPSSFARPEFFAVAPAGINCASGFIAFDPTGRPQLFSHDPDHRCRHVLPGHWQPSVGTGDPPAESLLDRLLGGVFKGDADEHDKRKFLAEIAGSAALGHATKLQQPKAIVLEGRKAENGKSQILDLLRGLLPDSAIASVTASKVGDERFIVGLRNT